MDYVSQAGFQCGRGAHSATTSMQKIDAASRILLRAMHSQGTSDSDATRCNHDQVRQQLNRSLLQCCPTLHSSADSQHDGVASSSDEENSQLPPPGLDSTSLPPTSEIQLEGDIDEADDHENIHALANQEPAAVPNGGTLSPCLMDDGPAIQQRADDGISAFLSSSHSSTLNSNGSENHASIPAGSSTTNGTDSFETMNVHVQRAEPDGRCFFHCVAAALDISLEDIRDMLKQALESIDSVHGIRAVGLSEGVSIAADSNSTDIQAVKDKYFRSATFQNLAQGGDVEMMLLSLYHGMSPAVMHVNATSRAIRQRWD